MKTRRSGMTLIELLVVIAIIALLASILFAVLGPVRQKTARTTCASNLHQMYVALTAYKQDNEGMYPNPDDGDVIALLSAGKTKIDRCPLEQEATRNSYAEHYNYWGYEQDPLPKPPKPLTSRAEAKATYQSLTNPQTGQQDFWHPEVLNPEDDGPGSAFPGLVNPNASKSTIVTVCANHRSVKGRYNILRLGGDVDFARPAAGDFWTLSNAAE